MFQQVELQLLWSDFLCIVSSTQEQFMLCSSPFLISPVHAELVPPARSGQSLNQREQVQRILWASCVVECGRERNNPLCPGGWDRNCLRRDSSFSQSFLLFWCFSESSWHTAAGQSTDAQVLKTQSLAQLEAKWNAGWGKKFNTRGMKPHSVCAIVCHSCGSPGQGCLFPYVYAVPSAGTAMSLRAVWESKNQTDRCPHMTYIFYLLTITATELSIITLLPSSLNNYLLWDRALLLLFVWFGFLWYPPQEFGRLTITGRSTAFSIGQEHPPELIKVLQLFNCKKVAQNSRRALHQWGAICCRQKCNNKIFISKNLLAYASYSASSCLC